MFKRFIAILSLLALMLGMIPGLASEDEAAARNTRAFQKFDKVVEVRIGRSIDPTDQTLEEGHTADDNVYYRYLLDNFNIKVINEWTAASGDDFNQKLSLSIAGNNLPDAVVAPDRTYFVAAAKANMLYDLTDLFNEYASQVALDILATTDNKAIENCTIDGKMLALPNTTVGTDGVIVMFIREDWLDQLGLNVPRTVSEIETVAKAFKEANLGAGGKTIPIIGAQKDGRVYHDYLHSSNHAGVFDPIFAAYDAYPGYWYEEDGEVTYGTLTENTKTALATLSSWYAQGLIDPEFATRDYIAEPINAGQVGIFFGPWWAMGYGFADIWKNTPDADWQAYPVYTDEGRWLSHMKEVGNWYTIVNKNVSEDVAKAIIIMHNVYKRDEGKLTNSTNEATSWYPLRNVMAPANESEYEYEQLWRVIRGEADPEEFNDPTSMYPLLYADALSVVEAITYNGEEKLHISNFDINHVNFNRLYAILMGDRPVSTLSLDKEVYSITYSNTDKMVRYWSNLAALEDEVIRKIITGKTDISQFDAFVQQWLDEGGRTLLDEVASLR